MKIPDDARCDPATALRKMCLEVISFRRFLLGMRANLPSPGYHLDLDPKKAAAAVDFMHYLPDVAAKLSKDILCHRKTHGGKDFQIALEGLRILCADPLQLYNPAALKMLETPEELFASVIAPVKSKEEIADEI